MSGTEWRFETLKRALKLEKELARLTGLEPATPGVTGRYSNQLSYNRAFTFGRSGGDGEVDGARTRDPRRDRPIL